MSTMSNILLDKEILLESGTNELEILVFDVADYTFGINVAKVREVMPATSITALPQAHPSIRGVFKLRNQVIPCVSLMDHLGISSTREESESTLVLTDLNQQQTAFLVDDVERIHRLSWENILAVPGLDSLSHTPVTALARCDRRLIVMLDFEMILDDVTEQYFRTDKVANPMGLPRENLQILLAEDSPTVREAIGETLSRSGYSKLICFHDGAEAWSWLTNRIDEVDSIDDLGHLLICDVEMPQIDGLHLTKRIKQHPQLRQLPVLLYSSIITADNHKKGVAVGADAQVSKPELTKVVELADELIFNSQRDGRASAIREAAKAAETVQQRETAATDATRPVAGKAVGPSVAPSEQEQPETISSAAGPLVEQCVPKPSTAPSAGLVETGESVDTSVDTNTESTSPPGAIAPENVNPSLWRTFHRELTGQVARLHELIDTAAAGELSDEVFQQTARTLHTVKSAAMVIPLDPVSHSTHLIESLLELARGNRENWPADSLQSYLTWLDAVISPSGDVNQSLAQSTRLQAQLTDKLAAVGG